MSAVDGFLSGLLKNVGVSGDARTMLMVSSASVIK